MIEPFVTIMIFLFLVVYARLSTQVGLFRELANMLALLTGLWVALRYWYPVTVYLHGNMSGSTLSVPAGNAALVGFWLLLVVVAGPLLVFFNRLDERYVPCYPRLIDIIGGFLCGIGTSLAVVCSVMITASVFIPKVWPGYDRATLLAPWDRLPIIAYQHVEAEWLGVTDADLGKTRFPTFAKDKLDDLDAYWQ